MLVCNPNIDSIYCDDDDDDNDDDDFCLGRKC